MTAADNRGGDPDLRAKTLLGTGEDLQIGALKLALNEGQAQPARRVVLVPDRLTAPHHADPAFAMSSLTWHFPADYELSGHVRRHAPLPAAAMETA